MYAFYEKSLGLIPANLLIQYSTRLKNTFDSTKKENNEVEQ